MKMSENEQEKQEMLSAFIDAEQSDVEISQVIDALLNEQEYKDTYIRMQLANDSMHEQIDQTVLNNPLYNRISSVLEDLPPHFIEDAVQLQHVATADVSRSHWFKKIVTNKVVSGVSVAASVMLVTLISLQTLNNDSRQTSAPAVADSNQKAPSLIQAPSELPVTLTATASGSVNNTNMQQKYHWIEADPALSRHIRKYINQHETNRAAYSLQPRIRTATYQVNE